ncbi:hypothetical protein [Halovivax cerinus]|uniref:DUF8135 domain-containing protein n=1 Tax=Halovivax cerinus TaxID=1487865 RepID=A0ABD5NPK0_9EURY|nr:hypothetical protein [Halovivax cerinus]
MTEDESESSEAAVDRDQSDAEAPRSSRSEGADGVSTGATAGDERSPGAATGERGGPGDDASVDDRSPEQSGAVASNGGGPGFEFDDGTIATGVTESVDDDRAFEELFEAVPVNELDSDRLWERLADDEAGPAVDLADREIREIDKHRYCHQCEHFTDPPTLGCEHDGTSILELVDVETFRVANCPVVVEEEALEEG